MVASLKLTFGYFLCQYTISASGYKKHDNGHGYFNVTVAVVTVARKAMVTVMRPLPWLPLCDEAHVREDLLLEQQVPLVERVVLRGHRPAVVRRLPLQPRDTEHTGEETGGEGRGEDGGRTGGGRGEDGDWMSGGVKDGGEGRGRMRGGRGRTGKDEGRMGKDGEGRWEGRGGRTGGRTGEDAGRAGEGRGRTGKDGGKDE